MKLIKNILIVFTILQCSSVFSQSKIHASITTNTRELGIKYEDAELILKTCRPRDQFLFTVNSVLINHYEINGRLITLFIDADGKLIACHSQKLNA